MIAKSPTLATILVFLSLGTGCTDPISQLYTPPVETPKPCTIQTRISIVIEDSTHLSYQGLGCTDMLPVRSSFTQFGMTKRDTFLHVFQLGMRRREHFNGIIALDLDWNGPLRNLPMYIDPIYSDSLAQLNSAIKFEIYPEIKLGSDVSLHSAAYRPLSIQRSYNDRNAVVSSAYKLSVDSLEFGNRYRLAIDHHYSGYMYIYSYIQIGRIIDSVKVDLHFENLVIEGA